jgi:hypothetical protein
MKKINSLIITHTQPSFSRPNLPHTHAPRSFVKL